MVTLFSKVTNALAIPLTLLILDFSGYIANADIQPQSTLTGIRLIVGPIPALLLVGGIIFAIFYPITREEHHKVVDTLVSRRKKSD